jgi:aminoglycoside phosphotransferase (APT) family kinase protein
VTGGSGLAERREFRILAALESTGVPQPGVVALCEDHDILGYPLLDLAGFCEIWCSVATAGWPTRPEVIERYRKARGFDAVPDLAYYEVLYNFRLAVLLEGGYQRSVRDPARAERHDLGDRVLANMARAVAFVSTEL